ncbi:MAG: hypothetical protein N2234_05430, partial [Planctomycetota bacterium]|nr:hypothetical protein [Planctomycetota bacterium]
MARRDYEYEEEELQEEPEGEGEMSEEEMMEEEEFVPPEEKPWWMHWAVPFLVSGGFHLLMIWISVMIIFLIPAGDARAKFDVTPEPVIDQPYDPTVKRDIFKSPRIEAEKIVEKPIIILDEEKPITRDVPRGTSFDNLSNKNLNSSGCIDAYGIGGGRAGAYGARWGHGSLAREGGSPGTESAVMAALLWLWRHQNRKNDPDAGGWDMDGYMRWCKQGDTCKNDAGASPYFDVAVSGFAVLAFLGHGNTHRIGKFRKTVQMGLEYLLKKQDSDGWLGRTSETHEWIYNHAIATMAICEAYAMKQDVWLREPCERALDCIIRAQNPGAGWRYD